MVSPDLEDHRTQVRCTVRRPTKDVFTVEAVLASIKAAFVEHRDHEDRLLLVAAGGFHQEVWHGHAPKFLPPSKQVIEDLLCQDFRSNPQVQQLIQNQLLSIHRIPFYRNKEIKT